MNRFKLIGRCNTNGGLDYILHDKTINDDVILPAYIVKHYAKFREIENAIVTKDGILRGINGTHIPKLPIISYKSNFQKKSLVIFDGDAIKQRFEARYARYKKRVQFNTLMDYLRADDVRVGILYGLRRTGKTVLMYQAAAQLGFSNCELITLTKNSTYEELISTLNDCKAKGIKYVFLDEITAMPNLLSFIAILSDAYASRNFRIVISGTYSYVLAMSDKNELYDRNTLIRTSYISFSEFKQLFPAASLQTYISYGGVLARSVFYAEDESERITKINKYIDTSISSNIVQSVLNYADDTEAINEDLALVKQKAFKSTLENIIRKESLEPALDVAAEFFRSEAVGKLRSNLRRIFNITDFAVIDNISATICYYLNVYRYKDAYEAALSQIDKNYGDIVSLLSRLDLFVPFGSYINNKRDVAYLFPIFGIRMNQYYEAHAALMNDEKFNTIDSNSKRIILQKLYEGVVGSILEQIIQLQINCLYSKGKFPFTDFVDVFKFTNRNGEYDCVVQKGDSAYLIEVKHSSECCSAQHKHLENERLLSDLRALKGIRRVLNRFVIYNGETQVVDANGMEIQYVNAEDFLLNTKKYIKYKS